MHADRVTLTQLHNILMATTIPMAHYVTAYLIPLLLSKAFEAELQGLVNVSASIEAASQELE